MFKCVILESTATSAVSTARPGSTVTQSTASEQTSTTAGSSSSAPTLLTTLLGTTVVTSEGTTFGRTSSSSTTKRCEEMQAIDKETSKKITVTPVDVPQKEKLEFLPTSNKGVSFPEDQKRPTITVTFGTPAEVQSVTIPRDQTPNANVERFEVTFYAPDGSKINEKPIQSSTSPKDDNKKPATVDATQIPSDRKVSRVEITIISTTNGETPKGVVLDIKACTEMTTGKCSGQRS